MYVSAAAYKATEGPETNAKPAFEFLALEVSTTSTTTSNSSSSSTSTYYYY